MGHSTVFEHRVTVPPLVGSLMVLAGLSCTSASFPDRLPSLMIEGCTVFDPEAAQMLGERTIVVQGERITAVMSPEKKAQIPADATRLDGRGRFAVPGLIDAHVHLQHVLTQAHVSGDEVLSLYLAAGVTSVRSTGDEIVAATLVARFARARPESSPRVFTCTPLLDADPPIHPDAGRALASPAQVPALFDDLPAVAYNDSEDLRGYASRSRPGDYRGSPSARSVGHRSPGRLRGRRRGGGCTRPRLTETRWATHVARQGYVQ
ncbi:MAG TPA: hypothetical protein PKY77_20680 [Phycisphaerae bacterium]|nr:hypothetical protein [Phycisphaerae bacterium]HRY70627.1 hypothetical protein [Phycisphaerae bacterium]HSA28940.1 hypothetical protein [Phycisphaerae bacterium]